MTTPASDKGTVLIVDDTPANLEILVNVFTLQGFEVLVATDGEGAIHQIAHSRPDLILLDVMMPGIDGFETCRRLKANPATKEVPVVFMTALSDTTDKIKGFKAGGVDYVTKPIQHEEVLARVTTHLELRSLHQQLQEANEVLEQRVEERTADLHRALQEVEQLKSKLQAENAYLQEEIKGQYNYQEIIHTSENFHAILHQVEQVAPTDSTVLILGESGTGKELLARAVHYQSKRKDRPLVKVNCASLPSNLIESELFGHEKGAFTGALTKKIGRFELADHGTIFLDEIGEMPIELQAKLLRVLQEGEFERLGNPKTTKVHVRIIAATNRDLEHAVKTGVFREDLYYRLNVFPITSLPLRDRLEDIPRLVAHFLTKFKTKIGKSVDSVSPEAIAALQSYHWPGNIRELENMTERAVILASTAMLGLESFPALSTTKTRIAINSVKGGKTSYPFQPLEDVERNYIHQVLNSTSWVVEGSKGAAAILGLNPSTLRSRMQKLSIKKSSHSD